ncbi:MAG TPA: sodium-dependent transporter, partial [bacterium (Candidatus Stahlbacteria)]|nr:sodium-dependent transporter [Candidatus Stahlbacteria bacterium]
GMDRWGIPRRVTNVSICVFGFLGGLIYTTKAGLYILDVVDHFLSNFGLVLVGLLECILIGYILKSKTLREYVNSISEFRLGKAWDFSIKILTPTVLIILLVFNLIERIRTPYGGYPVWIGWTVLLGFLVIAWLIVNLGRRDVD